MNNGSFLKVGDIFNDKGIVETSLGEKGFCKEFIFTFLEWLSNSPNRFKLSIYEHSKHYNNGEVIVTRYSDVKIMEYANLESLDNEDDLDDYSYCKFIIDSYNIDEDFWQCLPLKIDWLDTEYTFEINTSHKGVYVAILHLISSDTTTTMVFEYVPD